MNAFRPARVFGRRAVRALLAAASLSLGHVAVRAADVEGIVRDPIGNPISGAIVSLTPASGGFPDSTTTDGSGHYKLEFISPNCYDMAAQSATYGVVLYGDTILIGDRVEVGAQSMTGIDLQFPPSRTVTGTVTYAGAGNLRVGVLDMYGTPTVLDFPVFQGSPGQYPFTLIVPQGDWFIRSYNASLVSFDTYYPGAYSLGEASKVTVGANNVTGIDLTLSLRPVLDVHVRDSADAAVPAFIKVFRAGSSVALLDRTTGSDGDVTIPLGVAPGSDVFVNGYPGIDSDPFANVDGTTAAWSTTVTLSGGTDALTLHEVTPPSLAGAILEAGTGTPVDGAVVTLTAPVPIESPGAADPLTQNAFSGNFQFPGVASGWRRVSATGPTLLTDFHVPTSTPGLIHITAPVTGFDLTLPIGGRIQVAATRGAEQPWTTSGSTPTMRPASWSIRTSVREPTTFSSGPIGSSSNPFSTTV